MASKEIKLNLYNRNVEVFLYDGFFGNEVVPSPFHYHAYAEVHFTVSGRCSIYTEHNELESQEGTITIVPHGVIHMFMPKSEGIIHRAFLINSPVDKVMQKKVHREELLRLEEELHEYNKSGDFGKAAISIAYLCKDILNPTIKLTDIENREFIISEFFATRYNESVTLGDLAKELFLSEKQTARLVKRYMGESFSQIIQQKRMEAVELLLKTNPECTLQEIASIVGYNSYSGFWKAFKKKLKNE